MRISDWSSDVCSSDLQANMRILQGTAKKLGLAPEKVVVTVDRHANTSAASVPLALDEAVRDGRVKQGDLVVLEAMGGGFTWGAAAVRRSETRRVGQECGSTCCSRWSPDH